MAEQLRAAAVATGPGLFAVRSSAAAEDLPSAFFAGMYESYLNVGLDDLADAVQRCFDSAEADRVGIYQSSVRTDGGDAVPGAATAVLVQQMVDPASAGVASTANPLTGARDETVISAVPGLAKNLVAGVETGEEWIVRSGRPAPADRAGGHGWRQRRYRRTDGHC